MLHVYLAHILTGLNLFVALRWVLYQTNTTTVAFCLELVLLVASGGMVKEMFVLYK
jgi:hypothetical protein